MADSDYEESDVVFAFCRSILIGKFVVRIMYYVHHYNQQITSHKKTMFFTVINGILFTNLCDVRDFEMQYTYDYQ